MNIRTYKPRRWRVTRGQAAALATDDALLLPMHGQLLDLQALFDNRPVVLEIGFGGGAATAQMAAANPAIGILAVDVHTAGIGDLLARIRSRQLTNVRVVKGDALLLAHTMLAAGALAGIRLYFPDPWPKTRHHKRRLVTAANSASACCAHAAKWLLAHRHRLGALHRPNFECAVRQPAMGRRRDCAPRRPALHAL